MFAKMDADISRLQFLLLTRNSLDPKQEICMNDMHQFKKPPPFTAMYDNDCLASHHIQFALRFGTYFIFHNRRSRCKNKSIPQIRHIHSPSLFE